LHAAQLIWRNTKRKPIRTLLTVLTVGMMFSAFMFPRALVDAQRVQLDGAVANRLVVQPRRGWGTSLPARYAENIRQMDGVRSAAGCLWAAFNVPGKEELFFSSLGVEAKPFVDMHAEQLVTSVEQQEAFLNDPHGALISRDLAETLGWKLGEHHIVKSRLFPGEWDLNVAALYEPDRAEWARNSLWMHYGHLSRGLSIQARERMSYIVVELQDAAQGSNMAKAIDLEYDATSARTLTLQDRLVLVALVGRFQAILAALDVVSYMILAVVAAVLFNALSTSIRERTREFGVLRALGFGPQWLAGMVLGEAVLIGLAGAAVSLAISYPLLQGLVGPALRESINFPALTVPFRLALSCTSVACVLAIISAGWPTYRITKLDIVDALMRVR